jgi:hypothetical protein
VKIVTMFACLLWGLRMGDTLSFVGVHGGGALFLLLLMSSPLPHTPLLCSIAPLNPTRCVLDTLDPTDTFSASEWCSSPHCQQVGAALFVCRGKGGVPFGPGVAYVALHCRRPHSPHSINVIPARSLPPLPLTLLAVAEADDESKVSLCDL